MNTLTDIKTLTLRILTAEDDGESLKQQYLRDLVGATQMELGGTARVRAGKPAKLTAEERERQLGALKTVNERFYTEVFAVAKEHTPAGPDKGKRVNRRINWARTAAYAIRGWIRTGHDVTVLVAAKVTRAQLRVASTPRPASPAVLRRRLVEKGKDAMAAALELIDADRDAARAELELLMAQMATQLLNLGGQPTRNVQEAATQHKPFRVGKSMVFVPTETMVARQLSSPS